MLLRDRLLASDPSFERLRLALRSTSTMVLAGSALLALTHFGIIPGPVALLGTMVGLWASLQANDPAPAERKVTAALLPLAGAAGAAFGTVLEAIHPGLGAVGFLVVCFPAIWVRRYGPRGFALGTMALFMTFFAVFLKLEVRWLPQALLAIAVGGTVAWLVRFFVVTDAPHGVLAAARVTFGARMRLLRQTLQTGGSDRRDPRKKVREELVALDAAALSIDRLVAGEAFELDESARWSVRRALLENELAAGRLAEPFPHRGARVSRPALATANERMESALDLVARAAASGKADAPISPGAKPPDIGGISPTTRQAIQITAASALAMLAGTLIPPHQYFWAVLTAFIVYNQTASTSELLRRTVARTAGTVAGVGFAFGLVELVRGHDALEIGLAVASTFAALYAFRASYFGFTFFLTATIAMAYDVVGRPAEELLVVRLIETVVGAVCGAVAATLILPLYTQVVMRKNLETLAAKLRASVRASVEAMEGARKTAPISAVRELDAQVQQVIARSSASTEWKSGVPKPQIQDAVRAIVDAAASARGLADVASRATSAGPSHPLRLRSMLLDVEDDIAAVERALDGNGEPWREIAVSFARIARDIASLAAEAVPEELDWRTAPRVDARDPRRGFERPPVGKTLTSGTEAAAPLEGATWFTAVPPG
jgi:hypothetical protein